MLFGESYLSCSSNTTTSSNVILMFQCCVDNVNLVANATWMKQTGIRNGYFGINIKPENWWKTENDLITFCPVLHKYNIPIKINMTVSDQNSCTGVQYQAPQDKCYLIWIWMLFVFTFWSNNSNSFPIQDSWLNDI